MLTLATQIALIPAQYGEMREANIGLLQAMQDWTRGFPLLSSLLFVNTPSIVYRPRLSSASTGKGIRAHNAAFAGNPPAVATYDFNLRALGGDLTVDRQDLAGPQGAMNRAGLIGRQAMDKAGQWFEKFFHGDQSNADEFQGVDTFCDAKGRSLALSDTGRAVTRRDMEKGLVNCPGCNLILCNGDLAMDIDDLDDAKYRRVIDIAPGAPVPPGAYQKNYRGVPVLQVNQYASPDDGTLGPILPMTEAVVTPGAGNVNNVTSRITFLRLGLGGVYGAQREIYKLDAPQIIKESENNHLEWMSTPFVTDDLYSVFQLKAVKKSA